MQEQSILSQISFPDFLDQVQDGMYIVDSGRAIVYWNKAAEELTGFSSDRVIGRSCLDAELLDYRTLLGDSLGSEETSPVARCMASGAGGTVPHIIVARTSSGRPLPISLSVGALHTRDGKISGAIALFRGMRDEYQQRKLAVEIQKRTITPHGFTCNGVRVDTLFVPVDEIGGDFLEAFFLDERTLIVTLADATGHGISASLFTMVYKTLLHASFAIHRDPGKVLEHVNRGFLESAGIDGYYIGACLVRYDTATCRGLYAAAGHPHGLIFQGDGAGHRLREHLGVKSPMLGMNEASRFREVEFQLGQGELLLLTSDGIIDSPCGDKTPFGIAGIAAFFAGYSGSTPLEALLKEVKRRAVAFPAVDDISAVLLAPALVPGPGNPL
ncbi:MAG: PP2C family protein-serine/threonine phosphatase [Spirochaetia bacterium]